jgi:uroporphyrinogen decarboxylase
MTGRDVITQIIKHKSCPERVGVFEEFWQDTQSAWETQGLPPDTDLIEYFDFDFRPLEGSMSDTDPFLEEEEFPEEGRDTLIRINGWGARMRIWRERPGVPEHLSFDLTDETVWKDKYREPLLGLDLRRFPDLDRLRADFATAKAGDRFCYYYNILPTEILRRSMGDIVMLEAMCLKPHWVHDVCSVVTDNIIRHLEYILREVGIPDGVWMYEDMGYTQAPFFSPEMYREFLFPYHRRMGDFIHSYDLPFILHSCGKIRPLLPDIVRAGVDCLQAIEAKAGQHVAEMAEATGGNSLAFMGNIDIRAFESNDREVLEAEILPKLRTIREKRIPFVFHSDHSIPSSVRLETYEYAMDLRRRYGRY